MDYNTKHLLATLATIAAFGAGLFASGWALHAGIAWLAVLAGLFGGAGLMALGLFVYYFAD